MKNRNQKILLGLLVVASILVTGCGDNSVNQDEQTKVENGSDLAISEELLYTYDKGAGKKIVLDKENININEPGTYIISGTLQDGKIVVDVPEEEVKLVLDNANISSSKESPIHIKNAKRVIIVPDENTTNIVEESVASESGINLDTISAIFSETDIVIMGKGELKLVSKNGSGVHGVKNVDMGAGTYDIEANISAVYSDQNINISGGEFGIATNKDSIYAADTMNIGGANIKIESKQAGISGKNAVNITGSDIYMECEADGVYTIGNLEVGGSDIVGNSKSNVIYAEGNVSINGGNFKMNSDKDNIKSIGDIDISGSDIECDSKLGAIYGGQTVSINGCGFKINNGQYGINAEVIAINGSNGDITTDTESIISRGEEELSIAGCEIDLVSDESVIVCKSNASIAGSNITIGSNLHDIEPESQVLVEGEITIINSDIKDNEGNKIQLK